MRNLLISAGLAALSLTTAACQTGGSRAVAEQQALSLGYPFSNHRDCDGEVALRLQELGIAPAAIDSISYEDHRGAVLGREDDVIIGYDAYTRLKEQPGLLVIDLTPQCFIQQTYTRDGLSLPGLPAF